ncbi:uncharacterized protein PSANT_07048 [Moesziomyces antarcticus]|uniref:Uncharacterized protein n=1 Tax=Pseudozyma antarctica TaxID=84753 RepID=A0A5C3FZP5_PSEA2|nr:uncharacterized protein PSANT_07048 [Moesziomyces antarcticus]
MPKRTRSSRKPRPRRRRQAPPTIVPLSASEDDDTQDEAPIQRRRSPPLMDVDAESSDGSIVEIEQELSLTARVEDEEEDGNGLFDEAVGVNAGDSAHGRADRLDDDEEDIVKDQQDYLGDIEEPSGSYDSEEEEEGVVCDGIPSDEHADADDENELELVDEEDDNDAVLQRMASQVVAAAASSDGERCTRKANTRSELSRGGRHAELEKTIAWLLDPVKRLEVRDKQFADFVDPKFRITSDVPKSTGKLFLRRRAEKFVLLYNQYRIVANLPEVDEHLLRVFELFITDLMNCFDHPKEVPGWNPFAAFADLVEAGAVVRTPEAVRACSRLTLGADWSKFTDADRALPLALLEHGTKYIDKETRATPPPALSTAPRRQCNDLDDLDEDQHEQRSEASERDDDFNLDPMLNYVPQFGSAEQENAQFKVCPDCGFRFDGGTINPSSKFWRTIERAIRVAREQISAVQEFIELPRA